MYWGYHLILDSAKCIPKTIRCKQNIYNFTTDLVKKIDMVPYGQPQIQHFGSGNKAVAAAQHAVPVRWQVVRGHGFQIYPAHKAMLLRQALHQR